MANDSLNVKIRLSERRGEIKCDRIALSTALEKYPARRRALITALNALHACVQKEESLHGCSQR